MKTGQSVTDLALYVTKCCRAELIFDVDDVLFVCPQCNQRCVWELDEEIVRIEDLDRLNQLAA